MNNKFTPLLVVLLVIAAFLGGSLWAKSRYGQAKKEPANQVKQSAQPAAGQQAAVFKPNKTDKPEVKFFVMSFCPYGNQAEEGLKPVAGLLGDKVSWQPYYIVNKISQQTKDICQKNCPQRVFNDQAKEKCQKAIDQGQLKDMASCKRYFPYNSAEECIAQECDPLVVGQFNSLHGDQEKNQDIREICAWNMGDSQKWWSFVSSVNKNCTSQNADTCWETQAQSVDLDAAAIKACQQDKGDNLLASQVEVVDKYQVRGSPTVYINDVLYQDGRSPEDYKKAICDSFNTAPKECETVLTSGAKQESAAGSCN